MNGKIILNLAVSLDGYIADIDGGYDWIVGHNNSELNTDNKWSHEEFLNDIDVVVMGKNCYDQGMHEEFKNKEVYIATSKDIKNYENYHFISNNICSIINDLKNEGKNIYLFGGGYLVDNFIKENIIDEYVIGIIPTILGQGKKLFFENNPKIDLTLDYYSVEDGVMIMKYSKRSK